MDGERLKKLSLKLTADRENYMSSFRKNVDMYVAEKDITLREIAEDADLSYSTLNTFLYGNASDCKLSTAVRLARAFNVSIDELVGAETINPITRESIAICRNLPEHALYMIRYFIRHQEMICSQNDKKKKIISVLKPECVRGRLLTTNVVEPLDIDHLQDIIKTAVYVGLEIPCDHYMPYYAPKETILIAADREALDGERCVITNNGRIFIVTKQSYIEKGIKRWKYVALMNDKVVMQPSDIDDMVGYVVGFLTPDSKWGIR